jgi:hypothetical protein
MPSPDNFIRAATSGSDGIAANAYDPLLAACGLIVVASVLVNQDEAARTVLAKEMLKAARKLDPHLIDATWQ